ncbi:unnamed protein product [Rotaria sp. Silwood2]|nr:unnamed protein product [Rotaria sp. Silwood2]CAF4439908.1 unnamed protein product [Rotaria sp. Silwood2]
MKLEKLVRLKSSLPSLRALPIDFTNIDLHNLVKDDEHFKQVRDGLVKLKNDDFTIVYSEWKKVKHDTSAVPVSTKTCVACTLTRFINKFVEELDVSHAVSMLLVFHPHFSLSDSKVSLYSFTPIYCRKTE